MGTKRGTYPAVFADNRPLRLFVEIDRADGAGRHASAAAEAFFIQKQNAASGPQFQGVGGAYVQACGFLTPAAHDSDESAGHSAGRSYLNRAFDQ